ncbi:hypothetical protein CBS101457_004022 [Exobasidium rhododendri]|nr:hypothetical protein CBS101457_004022 [Exobasidium rhododendri]
MVGVSAGEAIDWLAAQRRRPDRQSKKVVDYGALVLEGGHLGRLGDDVWAFLEQVAIAALDVGRSDLAELCVARLNTRFPDSPRVASLQGMLLESSGELSKALTFYEAILQKDETNLIITKRMVAVLKSMSKTDGRGGIDKAISTLVKYLDTYYGDAEAWQELAAMYSDAHMYPQAAFALEELLLLVPHNSFFVLQYAETLYTAGEIAQSYKAYLRVLEMCGLSTDGKTAENTRQGPWTRALWGLKLVTAKLLSGSSKSGEVKDVEEIDAMVTDLLLNKAYKGNSSGVQKTRDAARALFS